MTKQNKILFTVGELAEKAGISVRTLQYYDRAGLLKSTLSEAGRRMYTRDDVFKLQQILFFKSFGFSLDEIKERILKFKSAPDLELIFTEQRGIIEEQIKSLEEITKSLDTVIEETRNGRDVSLDRLMTIMDLMKQGNPCAFVLRYFSSEQMENITERFKSSDSLKNSPDFTIEIIDELNALYKNGVDPAGDEGQRLAERWWKMVTDFTGGDKDLLKTLVGVGMDIGDWPEDAKDLKEAIENFLGTALDTYLNGKNINLSNLEVDNRE